MTKEEIEKEIQRTKDLECEACGEETENYFSRYCESCQREISNVKLK